MSWTCSVEINLYNTLTYTTAVCHLIPNSEPNSADSTSISPLHFQLGAVKASIGSLGPQKMRLQDFLDNRHIKDGKVFNPKPTGHPRPLRDLSLVLILLDAGSTPEP